MLRPALVITLAASLATFIYAQQKTAATKPPKTDLPYLLEAGRLIATESCSTSRSTSKDGESLTVSGVTSSARTPLPEPIFLFSSGQIKATDFELIHFQVANSQRQWTKGKQEHSDNEEPEEVLRLTLRPVAEGVVRIEAAEMLTPGEYALIPRGKSTAFCFTVF